MDAKRRELHPLVALDYRVRVPAMLIVALVVLSYFWDYPKSFWLWTAIGFTGLVWPQLLYLAARVSPDSRAAERRNLLFDSFLLGCWAGGMSFCPLPSIMMITAIIAACLSIGGVRFAIWAAGAVCAGMVFVGSFMGFRVDTSASITTTILSVLGTFSFTSIFGYYSHVQTRRWLAAKKELAAQNETDPGAVRRHRERAPVGPRGQRGRQAGEPGQERVPREHEPRAAHAPERDPRVQRDARRGRRGLGRRGPPVPTSRRS